MYKLDLFDRRLIKELDRNCRQTFAQLEKRLRKPAETIRYRTNALLEAGVISTFVTVVDAGMLGCTVHKVLLKMHNVEERQVQQLIRELTQHPRINWVVRMDGMYDVGFTIWTRGVVEVSTFVDQLKSKYHAYISRFVFAVNIGGGFSARDPVNRGARRTEKPATYETPKGTSTFDRTDFQILKALAANPRETATAIAQQVGITSETVGKRIKSLESEKVITGYRLVVNSGLIGELNYYVLIYLQFVSAEKVQRFFEYCRTQPLITYTIKALGEWDYELNVEVADVRELRALMMELTREFSDIVRQYYALPVSDIHKFMIMPPGAVYGE